MKRRKSTKTNQSKNQTKGKQTKNKKKTQNKKTDTPDLPKPACYLWYVALHIIKQFYVDCTAVAYLKFKINHSEKAGMAQYLPHGQS